MERPSGFLEISVTLLLLDMLFYILYCMTSDFDRHCIQECSSDIYGIGRLKVFQLPTKRIGRRLSLKKNIIKDDGVHCRKNVQKFWEWNVIMRSCEVVRLKTSLSPKALYVVWINKKIILPWFWCHNLFALWGFWLSCIRSTVEDGLHWVSFLSHPGLLLAWCCV